ncbi:CCA tRNA nucleotidyltransferase [Butyrivibrio sp. X503]|uniref:CCA tRNA nucleotidyltransferase n=1 Tax=Butyrivibrio sp. X503 TaxID=2364878 RepID=UPI000EA94127|nr:CCA tRNA nucleotidyltransferase [Butyrivibrio sp. X503]RKM54887.1 CCA tRNA nucleotidyltransferase [Butyrivibrio sp. X503]
MIIKMPENAKFILDTMHKAGFEAYIVGGCVRDALLGREPMDWDITTNALPEDTKKLFRRTIDTGIEHGTVTVMMGKEGYEVTTYRIDGKYEDSRHPSEVTFTKNLTEDMRRRDFTINAMAYNDEEGLIDRFGGVEDLEKKLIRCVGNAHERFSEDALRIMRAVRFSAQLDYEIEEETKEAIKELAPTLKKISAERIQVELIKLLESDHPEKFMDLYDLGITKVVLPEFDACMETEQNNPHHLYDVGTHIVKSLSYVKSDKVLRLAMLLHDIGKPLTKTNDDNNICHFHGHAQLGAKMAEDIFRRLKFDRDTMDRVCNLIKYHDDRFPAEPRSVRRAMNRVGVEDFTLLLDVKYADTMAQSSYYQKEKLQALKDIRVLYDKIKKENDCVTLKQLAVGGKDLICLGIAPGRQIGDILNAMLSDVIDEPAHNTKEYLLEPERLKNVFMKEHEQGEDHEKESSDN